MLFPVVNFLKHVVTEFLFSIVAFKTLNISQGSVETHFKCGGIFSYSIIANFLLILAVKQLLMFDKVKAYKKYCAIFWATLYKFRSKNTGLI